MGFENAGFETVFSNDFESKCKTTFDLNFQDPKMLVEDIRNIDPSSYARFQLFVGRFSLPGIFYCRKSTRI